MGRVKNDVLKMSTYIAGMMAVLSGYMTELEPAARIALLGVSITWISLFTIANRKKVN